MKEICSFFKKLFGCKLQKKEQSINNINVIHEEVTGKQKKELVINPRLTTSMLRHYLINNGILDVNEMSRKEKQFYAKKIYFLRYKRGMNISFDKSTKTYKYSKYGV